MEKAEQGFLCLACKEMHSEPDIPSLEKHFAAKHGVPNLLASPATQAVMPPRKIRSGCHASSCNPCEPLYGCLFCGGPGLQEKMMKEHLKRVHGNFFQNSWKDFCVSHCSCLTFVQWGWGPVLNPDRDLSILVKKEEDIMTAGGDLVLANNKLFTFEEMKRDQFRFSTNKVKRDIEMEIVKTEKEGLKLTGLEMLKVEQETAKAVMEKPEASIKEECNKVFQSPLDEIRAEKCDVEKELSQLRIANMMREELEGEKKRLDELKSEVMMAKKEEISKNVKLAAVAANALLDPKRREKLTKYGFEAQVEMGTTNLKGDVAEVTLKGTAEVVEKADNILRKLTSEYTQLPLKDSEVGVVVAGEHLLLEQIRRMTNAAIGFKERRFYIFGAEEERLEAEAVVKRELKLCASSSLRRWGFLRKSSRVGWK